MKRSKILVLLALLLLNSCSSGYKPLDDKFLETMNFAKHEEIVKKTGRQMTESVYVFNEVNYTIVSPSSWSSSLEFKNASGVCKYKTYERNSSGEIVPIDKTVSFEFANRGAYVVEFTCYILYDIPCEYEFISISGSYKWEE